MSFGSRLKERRKELGISQPQLAEMLGVTKGAIGNWESDTNSPRAALLYKVFDVLKCDANYLFQDEMEALMNSESVTPKEYEKIIKVYRSLDDSGKKFVDLALTRESERIETLNNIRQKLLNEVIEEKIKEKTEPYQPRLENYQSFGNHLAAGVSFDDLAVMLDNPPETVRVPFCDGADFIMGVNGDSMEPDFSDGDMVYIHKTPDLNFGDIGMFTIGNECYIKEYSKEGLVSHNPKYKIIPASKDIKTIGKVLGKVPDKVKTEE